MMALYTYQAKLVRVVDGDTLVLELDLGFHITYRSHIRLLDVDTPEIYGRYASQAGRDAKQFVLDWLRDSSLTIISRKYNARGKYGRVLAEVWKEGHATSLNQDLVVAGFEKGKSLGNATAAK